MDTGLIPTTRVFGLQVSILGALEASFSIRMPPTLTSLSLHNLRTWDLSPLDSPPFQTALTTLQHLQLSMVYDNAPDLDTALEGWSYCWSTHCTRMVLGPTQHSLTELTLHNDRLVGASVGLSFARLHFPRLCVLSLRGTRIRVIGQRRALHPATRRHPHAARAHRVQAAYGRRQIPILQRRTELETCLLGRHLGQLRSGAHLPRRTARPRARQRSLLYRLGMLVRPPWAPQ